MTLTPDLLNNTNIPYTKSNNTTTTILSNKGGINVHAKLRTKICNSVRGNLHCIYTKDLIPITSNISTIIYRHDRRANANMRTMGMPYIIRTRRRLFTNDYDLFRRNIRTLRILNTRGTYVMMRRMTIINNRKMNMGLIIRNNDTRETKRITTLRIIQIRRCFLRHANVRRLIRLIVNGNRGIYNELQIDRGDILYTKLKLRTSLSNRVTLIHVLLSRDVYRLTRRNLVLFYTPRNRLRVAPTLHDENDHAKDNDEKDDTEKEATTNNRRANDDRHARNYGRIATKGRLFRSPILLHSRSRVFNYSLLHLWITRVRTTIFLCP